MMDDIRRTWNEIADHWDDWGPPLRPDAEDLRIMREALSRWHAKSNLRGDAQVLLCGVTPEIATMDWPFPIRLLAIDKSASMVRAVWPGDVLNVRRGIVGDWFQPPVDEHSQHVAITDGGFGFFDYPESEKKLLETLYKALRPGGLVLVRLYAQTETREPLAQVIEEARAGRIGNFHIFKWRLAMALQPDSSIGVKLDDVWRACRESGLDPATLPQPGWSPQAVGTIHYYRDQGANLCFPTLKEFVRLANELFEIDQVTIPDYELGERCPILTMTPAP